MGEISGILGLNPTSSEFFYLFKIVSFSEKRVQFTKNIQVIQLESWWICRWMGEIEPIYNWEPSKSSSSPWLTGGSHGSRAGPGVSCLGSLGLHRSHRRTQVDNRRWWNNHWMIRIFLGVILGIYWDLWGESLGFIGIVIGICWIMIEIFRDTIRIPLG